jgi:hypothetical protein
MARRVTPSADCVERLRVRRFTGQEKPLFFQKQKDLPVRFINYTFRRSLELTKLTEGRAGQSLTQTDKG